MQIHCQFEMKPRASCKITSIATKDIQKSGIKDLRQQCQIKPNKTVTYQATEKSQQYPNSITIFVVQGILQLDISQF